MINAQEALARLKAGNQRYLSDGATEAVCDATRRNELASGQAPFAVILGCADSRVPAEIVFDEGLGDLFVIRVAGNIAASTQIGSIEYAAAHLGTRLIVVLGHTMCGAVQATLDELAKPSGSLSPGLQKLVDLIGPAVKPALDSPAAQDRSALVAEAVRANVRATVEHLQKNSEILAKLIAEDGLQIVGAEYSLETGKVEFFDGATQVA